MSIRAKDRTLTHKKTFMYFAIHKGSDKGNRKTKKLLMSFIDNKTEIASDVLLVKYDVLL